jgi:membrane fusion protein (multidrug efflux system)
MRSINLHQMLRSVRKAAALALAAGLVIGALGCRKAASSVPPPVPQVVVAAVIQRDVPVYSEWVGTTEGFVNAEIYPKISGYLL